MNYCVQYRGVVGFFFVSIDSKTNHSSTPTKLIWKKRRKKIILVNQQPCKDVNNNNNKLPTWYDLVLFSTSLQYLTNDSTPVMLFVILLLCVFCFLQVQCQPHGLCHAIGLKGLFFYTKWICCFFYFSIIFLLLFLQKIFILLIVKTSDDFFLILFQYIFLFCLTKTVDKIC